MYAMSLIYHRESTSRWMQLSNAFYRSIDIEATPLDELDTYFSICYI